MTRRTAQEKLTIVEQTFVPGMSISRVARDNDVNANQVFDWHKQYHEGRLGSPQNISDTWIPVMVETAPAIPAAYVLSAETVPDENGTVFLELPKYARFQTHSDSHHQDDYNQIERISDIVRQEHHE